MLFETHILNFCRRVGRRYTLNMNIQIHIMLVSKILVIIYNNKLLKSYYKTYRYDIIYFYKTIKLVMLVHTVQFYKKDLDCIQ